MIIHILVDISKVLTQDNTSTCTLNILYDQQQIYLHLLLQVHNSSNIYQIFKIY